MQSLNNRDEMNESEVVNLPAIQTRAANRDDLPRLTEICNYYVVHTPITFDVKPWAVEQRISWFEQFDKTGRYRLLVAEQDSLVVGYAGTTRFRPKAAYDTTVETTIYCAAEFIGKGLGTQLYAALFRLYPERTFIASSPGMCRPTQFRQLCTNASDSNQLEYFPRTAISSTAIGMSAGWSAR